MGWDKTEGLYHMVKLVQLRGFSLNSCWLSPDWECSGWVGWGGLGPLDVAQPVGCGHQPGTVETMPFNKWLYLLLCQLFPGETENQLKTNYASTSVALVSYGED